jgi:hypothetical protein
MAGCRVHEENDMSPQIRDQHAGVINNVDGDQVIYGGQHGTVITSEDARRAVHDLRGALPGAALDDATAAEARARVAEIDAAVYEPEPDKQGAAGPLKRLVKLLADAGSLATAGAALIGPLQTLASWLGAHGAAILSLLAL